MNQKNNDQRFTPPHSIDAEQSVLGAILKDSKSFGQISEYFLDENYFYFPKHKLIFRTILALFEESIPIDITNVAEDMTNKATLEKCGERSYLIDLIDGVASTVNIKSYAEIVIEKFNLRKLINICSTVTRSCYDLTGSSKDLIDDLEGKIFRLNQTKVDDGFVALAEYLPRTFAEIERYTQMDGNLTGLSTGYKDIDEKTAGLQDGDFIVIAGRPSMGKTALALNIAANVATEHPVLFISLEMDRLAIAERLLASAADVNSTRMRTGTLSHEDRKAIVAAAAEFLKELLADEGLLKEQVSDEADDAGYSKAILDSAKIHLGIKPQKTASGWFWALPKPKE